MAAQTKCGHFLRVAGGHARKGEQASMQGDKAAKVMASIIIAGPILMFGYGLLGWIVFG
jgi:hypothetical protein